MRLLNQASALLLPALASTTVLASTAPAPILASPTTLPEYSDDVQLVGYWSPISTITHLTPPTAIADAEADLEHDLLRREVVTGVAAAAPTVATQVSPVTTLQVYQMVNGVPQQVQVVYTQLFSAVPDQGDPPASGEIGLGTIQGQVGVVKTARKRDAKPEPTELADIKVEKRMLVEGSVEDGAAVVKRRSLAGKVDANKAGSALALLVAIAGMIVV
jgi:hypothetical protein